MRTKAINQNAILSLLLQHRKPMTLREVTHKCQLTYHQVASCLGALRQKGMVRRVRTGLYEVTEEAKLTELSPDTQIKILKEQISELENQVKSLVARLAKSNVV